MSRIGSTDVRLVVTEAAMRPASPLRQCFYCQEPVGGTHKPTCVLVLKRVKVRMTVEYETDVPFHWDKDMFYGARNVSSNCLNNDLRDMVDYFEDLPVGCACGATEVEMLEEVSGPFLKEK